LNARRLALKALSLAASLLAAWAFPGSTSRAASFESSSFAELPVGLAFAPLPIITPGQLKSFLFDPQKDKTSIARLCADLGVVFKRYGWEQNPCGSIAWKAGINSHDGRPLIYAEFGSGEETTLLLGGVHPDELTPIPIAFRFARLLHEKPELYANQGIHVVVAPLVNPDGFLRVKDKPSSIPTRTNKWGVDLNRNFFTADWYPRAKHWWEERRQKSPSHFPGYFPNSEIETIFQIQMIDEFDPDKILSIHAPLGFLDYDGPGDQMPRALTNSEAKAKRLVRAISESSKNYRIVDYSFYPGSLGNYAGNERNIPTITLELETTHPAKMDGYWNQFRPGLEALIRYPFHESRTTTSGNATRFYSDHDKRNFKPLDSSSI
jgi:protein MpaA